MPPRGYRKEKPTFKCELCAYTSQRQSCFNDHLRVHSGEKPFKCDLCGKSFTQKSNLGQHLKVHGAGAKHEFRCERKGCDFTSKWKSSLLIHERWHDGERPYQCTLCEKTFTQSTHCRTHMRESHGNERKYQCEQCSKCFKRSDHLTRHMAFHKAEKNYACEVCGKRFIDMGGLRSHRRIHEGEEGKKYKCDKCPYKSFFKQCLDVHYRIHLGLKPYECGNCGKKFRTSSSVKIHIRMVHQGEEGKIFSCEQCSFSTANKQSLKNHHRRIHQGYKERAWLKCLTCGKVYTTRSSYYSHRRKRHPKLPRVEDIYRRGQKVTGVGDIKEKQDGAGGVKEPGARRKRAGKKLAGNRKEMEIDVKDVVSIKRKGNVVENITVKVASIKEPKRKLRKAAVKAVEKMEAAELKVIDEDDLEIVKLSPRAKPQKSPAAKLKKVKPMKVQDSEIGGNAENVGITKPAKDQEKKSSKKGAKGVGSIRVKLKQPKMKATKKAKKPEADKEEAVKEERKAPKRKKMEPVAAVAKSPPKLSRLDSVAESLAKKSKKNNKEKQLATETKELNKPALPSEAASGGSGHTPPKANRRKSQSPKKSTGPRFSPLAMPRQDATDIQTSNVSNASSPGSEERSLVQVAPVLSMKAYNSDGRPIHVKFVPVLAQTEDGAGGASGVGMTTQEVCESIQKQALDIAARVKDELVSSGVRVSATSTEKSADFVGQSFLQGNSPRSKEINVSPLITAGALTSDQQAILSGNEPMLEENNNEFVSSEPLDLSVSTGSNNNNQNNNKNNNIEKTSTDVTNGNGVCYDPENVINITPIEYPSGRKSKNGSWSIPERDFRKKGRPPKPMKQKTISVADPSRVISSMVINVNLAQESMNAAQSNMADNSQVQGHILSQATKTRQRKH